MKFLFIMLALHSVAFAQNDLFEPKTTTIEVGGGSRIDENDEEVDPLFVINLKNYKIFKSKANWDSESDDPYDMEPQEEFAIIDIQTAMARLSVEYQANITLVQYQSYNKNYGIIFRIRAFNGEMSKGRMKEITTELTARLVELSIGKKHQLGDFEIAYSIKGSALGGKIMLVKGGEYQQNDGEIAKRDEIQIFQFGKLEFEASATYKAFQLSFMRNLDLFVNPEAFGLEQRYDKSKTTAELSYELGNKGQLALRYNRSKSDLELIEYGKVVFEEKKPDNRLTVNFVYNF